MESSVHTAPWPTAAALDAPGGLDCDVSPEMTAAASEVLGEIRKVKSEARLSMKAEVKRLVIEGPRAQLQWLESVQRDLCDAGQVKQFELSVAEVFHVRVELT